MRAHTSTRGQVATTCKSVCRSNQMYTSSTKKINRQQRTNKHSSSEKKLPVSRKQNYPPQRKKNYPTTEKKLPVNRKKTTRQQRRRGKQMLSSNSVIQRNG
ncbi:unnamed protein product, partial [Ectocarpus sp. 8 AP-2014]